MLQWIVKNKYNKIKAVTILGVILVAVFLSFNTALAQNTLNEGLQVIEQPLGLSTLDIRLIIANIIRAALGLTGLVMLCLMLYAGYLWMTSGGNEDQIAQAKGIIRNAVIGLAIILSAYSIVLFVMRMLGIGGSQSNQNNTSVVVPNQNYNFSGSGALGRTVKDHYPARDQKDVPRNTKIVITFSKPILLNSFVQDTNSNYILGDCVRTEEADFNWNTDCDHVTSTPSGQQLMDDYISVKRTDSNEPITGLVVLSSTSTYNGAIGHFTIVLKPITNTSTSNGGYLGSEIESVGYTVRLGKNLLEDNYVTEFPPMFQQQKDGNDFYAWQFITNNSLDITPPTVVDVFPALSAEESRNSVIQINFSEPIDPTGLQGDFIATSSEGANYFFAPKEGGSHYVYLKNERNILPEGTFNLVNNYQTLEFTPSVKCGVNACGEDIFCLAPDNYTLLLQAARSFAGTFQSMPFTGVADMSSNALDGNKNNTAQNAPTLLPVFNNWLAPDNYFWNFKINDEIDISSPYLRSITPTVNSDNVEKNQAWKMVFSKNMRAGSLSSIELIEYPTVPPTGTDWVPLYYRPLLAGDHMTVNMDHGPFLDDQFYMPVVDSRVEDVNFNCFYPGIGPDDSNPVAGTLDSQVCDLSVQGSCCSVEPGAKDFCCNGLVSEGANFTKDSCINWIKENKNLITTP